jgi:hypothetical protein
MLLRIKRPSSVRRLDVTARRLGLTGRESYCSNQDALERRSLERTRL